MSKAKKKYDAIFEPITIGNVEIKNRIAMAPMNMNFTDPNHYVSRQQMAYYAARAKGGTGLDHSWRRLEGRTIPTTDTYRKYNNASLANELFRAADGRPGRTRPFIRGQVLCSDFAGSGPPGHQ